ncbi:MAG: cation transporter, partial [Candidatus Thermoplasmatota archaeon]|nr:cation transporter [Candidatus Thermoplasmatota archaeon]
MLRESIPSDRVMDDSDGDILLVEDMDEPVKSSSKSPLSSQKVLDAEIPPSISKRQISSVFSSMVDSVKSLFKKIIAMLKSTSNSAASKVQSIKKSRNEKQNRRLAIAQSKASQDEMVMVASEIQLYTWEILGMDCPDCATKANQAISRMDGVESCDVSVMEGTITVGIDLSLVTVSRLSRILDGIGFPPNRLWETIQGVTPKMIEDNRMIDRRTLRREIQNVPEILDIQMIDGQIQIKRVSKPNFEMSDELRQGLFEIIGIEPVLSISEGNNLRPDQWRLLGAITTLPILATILLLESNELVMISQIIAFLSVLLIGWPMFMEALNGLRNGIFSFQILTTSAVIGAMVLQEYSEALMVVGLVAFASHLEEHAIVKARKSMQGGLDRLPQEARLIQDKMV